LIKNRKFVSYQFALVANFLWGTVIILKTLP
jgi:hypothetical protein